MNPAEESDSYPLETTYTITTNAEGYEKLAGFPKLNRKTGIYELSVLVHSDESFKLVPTLMRDGQFEGLTVLVPERYPQSIFRFMDLPAELRIDILRRVLRQNRTFIILSHVKNRYGRRDPGEPYIFCPVQSTYFRKNRMEDDPEEVWWPELPPSTFAALYVSKQMWAEAAPIAYSSNIFSFKGVAAFHLFAKQIGPMRKYLKHISLASIQYRGLHKHLAARLIRTLPRFQDYSSLRTVEFSLTLLDIAPDQLVEMYRMLLQSAYETAKANNYEFDVDNAVRVREVGSFEDLTHPTFFADIRDPIEDDRPSLTKNEAVAVNRLRIKVLEALQAHE